jgi:hypothetical protein
MQVNIARSTNLKWTPTTGGVSHLHHSAAEFTEKNFRSVSRDAERDAAALSATGLSDNRVSIE